MSTKTKELEVESRTEFGSSASRRLRRQGLIPSVVYGGKDIVHVSVNARRFHAEFHGNITENTIINLLIGGKGRNVLVKDFQADILTQEVHHIDFLEVVEGHLLKTHVPLILDGSPVGVREGGMLEHQCESVEVECLPKDLPAEFRMDIGHLKLGEFMALSELKHDPAVRILGSMEQIVAHISVPRGLASAEADGEAAGKED
ncbi:50S ribosomal protein L25 [Candidatus Haliotispira prima]|uniref:Large ribosomal subunit protein bL25 n=1 Tax=Candidatus Haliotispira prima TaxID=3034016 RepID=A0ABY8MI11_9SPIO|nr:50S ribosomal protein L25 [Candidatus Haliotispira prima]